MKTRHFLFLAFFVYLLGISTLAAQTNPSSLLRGIITNQKGEPVPYANTALLSPEGLLLEGAVSDEAGAFSIARAKAARVKLVISSLGYTSYSSEEFELLAGLQKDFGTLVLADEVTGLDEVTVKASRPQIIIEPDKTIVNEEGTVMAEGANALDVLGRSPGVFITSDGSINLKGRTGVTVMINDRPMYMSAADLTSFLRSKPADNIKSIEVITSASARFDAEDAAWVINIQLKKNTVDGVFGNVMLGGQYNGKIAPNAGIIKSVMKDKLSLSINGGDLFRTYWLRAGTDFGAIDTQIRQYRNEQSVRFRLRYNFSKGQSFRVNSNSGSSEERKRLD